MFIPYARGRLLPTLAGALLTASLLIAAPATFAAEPAPTPAPTPSDNLYGSNIQEYFNLWFLRSQAAKDMQPHWMTPVATVTPLLQQEFRYDQMWQHLGNGANIDNFDSGKGLELIPTLTNEVLINLPPYIDRSIKKPANGFGDWGFLVVKQRLLSANEQNGDYIVSAFLGLQAPTGITPLTSDAWVVTPTIAGGIGFGRFDVQSTLSVSLPTSNVDMLGDALAWNTAFQYHAAQRLWPEFEVNMTHWYGGLRDGKTQVFLTPGLVLGRFPLVGRLNLAVGLGYQVAVTPKVVTSPVLTPTYNHAWILTVRTPF